MIKNIWGTFGTVPLSEIRNGSVGDWRVDDESGTVSVLAPIELPQDYAFLVLVHELVEWYLCMRSGIADADVTEFDARFEIERAEGFHEDNDEPGDAEACPYRCMHQSAESIERHAALALGIDWCEYCMAFDALSED